MVDYTIGDSLDAATDFLGSIDSDWVLTPEMANGISNIISFAKDGDGTIDDVNIDGFFDNISLSQEDKQNIRALLSDGGVEIIYSEKLKSTPRISEDDLSDYADEFHFESDVSYDRYGNIDGYTTFVRNMRSYPLLTPTQEVEYSKSWQTALAAEKVLAKMQSGAVDVADEDIVKTAIPEGLSEEDQADYYIPLIGSDEAKLKALVSAGKEAKDLLILSNARLSIAFAKRLTTKHEEFEDLYMAGFDGLAKACDKYNYRKGFRFSTYATWWIRQSQTRARNDYSRCIRIPSHVYDKMAKIKNTTKALIKELGRDPSSKEVAERIGIREDDLIQLKIDTSEILSMDLLINPTGDRNDFTTMENYVPVDETALPENIAEQNELSQALFECVSSIPKKDADVLCLRLGLFGNEKATLEEISAATGVTKERVRQIESHAYKQLRSPIYRKKLREYTEFAL